jgi:hypothetical protein
MRLVWVLECPIFRQLSLVQCNIAPYWRHHAPQPALSAIAELITMFHIDNPLSFVEPSCFDELCNLIFACLISVRLPDLVKRYKLLRALNNSFNIDVALCKPVH